MSEIYSPAGNAGALDIKRATAAEAATGTHGAEFMRDNITRILDRIRFFTDAGWVGDNLNVLPTNGAADKYAADASGGLAVPGVPLANNATRLVGGAGTFSGIVIVNDCSNNGSLSLFLCGGTIVVLVAANVAEYSAVAATAGKINLYYNGTQLTLENKMGVSRTLQVMAFRTRASA